VAVHVRLTIAPLAKRKTHCPDSETWGSIAGQRAGTRQGMERLPMDCYESLMHWQREVYSCRLYL